MKNAWRRSDAWRADPPKKWGTTLNDDDDDDEHTPTTPPSPSSHHPHHRHNVHVPLQEARPRVLRQHQGHPRPHQAQGLRRARDPETSPPIHHPQCDAPRPYARAGAAGAVADALLYAADADPKPLY
ncbi:hypothetical protein V493_01839 [Pseudogymnoascus sp. VKM F-4281 (FW-2241)]|nr:hypothetical protein V493_01839 [Pseudogymnoascus sp. VKM F-4281 (FW-2241)]